MANARKPQPKPKSKKTQLKFAKRMTKNNQILNKLK